MLSVFPKISMSLLIGEKHRQLFFEGKIREAHCNFARIGSHGFPDSAMWSGSVPLSAEI
jgi:hypothetical protein